MRIERKATAEKKLLAEKELGKKKKSELQRNGRATRSHSRNKENESIGNSASMSSGSGNLSAPAGTDCEPSTSGSNQNECSVYLGLYEDDLVDGVLVNKWIRCTNVSCGLWMHCDCLSPDGNCYECYMCNTVLK